MKTKLNLKDVLNFLMIIEIIVAAIFIIIGIWIDTNWVDKVLLTDLVMFVTGGILYWLLYYGNKKQRSTSVILNK